MSGQDEFNVLIPLSRIRRGVGLARLARWVQCGVAGGGAMAAIVLLIAHLYAFHSAVSISLGCAIVGILGGVLIGVRRWPTIEQTARLADHRLALDDRLSTALQYSSSSHIIAVMQRADVESSISDVRLEETRRGERTWRESAGMAAALLSFAGLLALGVPAPSPTRVHAASSDRGRIRHAALIELPAIVRGVQRDLPAQARQDAALREMDQRLALLRHQLLQAQSRQSALRVISVTQQQLVSLQQRIHPVDLRSIGQVQRALSGLTGLQTHPGTGTNADAQATARSLSRLTNTLSQLPIAQRDRVAATLERAANSVSDPRLRQALRQAASSLAYDDPAQASRALQKAASFLASTPIARISASRLKAAARQLEQLKRSVSGVSLPQGGNRSQSKPGQKGSKRSQSVGGRGRASRQGPASSGGRGTGISGQTYSRSNLGPPTGVQQAAGRATTNGKTGGIPSRQAGEGGRVLEDPSSNSNKQHHGKLATVYVPGIQGRGPHTIQTGQSATPSGGAIISYHQVFVQYAQSARAALDRTELSPSLQAYVRAYFDKLSR